MNDPERSKTTTSAVIQNGKIVSGGWSCAVCGKPTLAMSRVDPFGKSDRREPRCDEHSTRMMSEP